MLAIIYRYYREAVLLTTGSYLPNSWVVPGVSLHQEMELRSEAGIPKKAVVAMATCNPACVLGLAREIATVETGKRADLVVLDADPLTDIHNTRTIEYVLHNGRLLQPAALLTKEPGQR
jgi:imidazolonepropionase-like amidohydrolase